MSVSEIGETALAADVLLMAAHPGLYRVNAFRILGLPADASARDLSKHLELLEMAEKFGRGQVKLGLLDMQPPPDTDAVRAASQRLRDPELRLVDELFWFWPHALGEGKRDLELAAVGRGEIVTAEAGWRLQELQQSDASVSAHNLAVLSHARALDLEFKARSEKLTGNERQQRDQWWQEAISRWRILLGKEGFWNRVKGRIRELDDPRLTPELAQLMRTRLLRALSIVSARLAVEAAERGDAAEAERHKAVLAKWGEADGAGQTAQEALREALKPLRERINTLCRMMEAQADADRAHADQVTRRLIDEARPLLAALDLLLPAGDPRREGAHDEVALRALTCQIVFGNKTDNWVVSEKLLEEIIGIAAGAAARTRVEQNLNVVRRNKLFGVCYFCAQNPADDKRSYTVPVHGNVQTQTVAVGYNYRQVRTTWQHSEVKVPRCAECAAAHRRYSTARALGPWMGIVFALVTVSLLANCEGYFDSGPAMGLPYTIGVLLSFVISINLGLGVARAWIRGRKPPGALRTFPPLVERLRTWRFGAGPGKTWSAPHINNPERGKLGNWEPFRRRILARPGLGPLLLVGVPLALSVILYLSVPLLGFVEGVPEATWAFYRHGLLTKSATIERLSGLLAEPLGQDLASPVKAQMRLGTVLGSLDSGDRQLLPTVENLTRSGNPAVARAAMEAFVKIDPGTAVPKLTGLLTGSEQELRPMAAELLGGAGTAAQQAVPALQSAAEGADPVLRSAAETALVKLAPQTRLPKLIERLRDPNVPVRKEAAELIGLAGPAAAAAIPALEKAAADRDSAEVQTAANVALMKIAPNVYVPRFAARMPGLEPWAQVNAVRILGEVGPAASQARAALETLARESNPAASLAAEVALVRIVPDSEVPKLIERLTSLGSDSRVLAANVLAEAGPAARQAAEVLGRVARRDFNPQVQQAAQAALDKVAPETSVVRATTELGNMNAEVRLHGATTLGKLGPAAAGALPALQKAVRDPVSNVSWAAKYAIVRIAPEAGLPRLIAMLDDPSGFPERAALALGEIGPRASAAVPALQRLANGSNANAAAAAETALARIAPNGALPKLIARLKDRNWQVRQKAAQDLGTIGSAARQAVPALERAAQDSDQEVSQAASAALGSIAPERTVPLLVADLRSANWLTRQRAAQALGKIGPAAGAAEPALRRATNDTDPDVRRAAVEALPMVAAGNSMPAATGTLTTPDRPGATLNIRNTGIVGTWLTQRPSYPWHFREDGTFDNARGTEGRWSIHGDTLIMRATNQGSNFSTWRLRLTNSGNTLEGTWSDPSQNHGMLELQKQ